MENAARHIQTGRWVLLAHVLGAASGAISGAVVLLIIAYPLAVFLVVPLFPGLIFGLLLVAMFSRVSRFPAAWLPIFTMGGSVLGIVCGVYLFAALPCLPLSLPVTAIGGLVSSGIIVSGINQTFRIRYQYRNWTPWLLIARTVSGWLFGTLLLHAYYSGSFNWTVLGYVISHALMAGPLGWLRCQMAERKRQEDELLNRVLLERSAV